jgi:NADH-quinone oxidoreductase subunit F
MLYNEPSPLEVKVLSRRFGLPNSASIDTYLATDGYKSTQSSSGKTCTEDRPRGYINSSEGR